MAKRQKMSSKACTIGQYLLDRLYDQGVEHIFGLPGDYVIRFDKLIEQHAIQYINTTRENTAGYMADAYARLRGLGVACITYGVGINITNALSQAYAESSPMVVISGAAGTNEIIPDRSLHHLLNKSRGLKFDTTQLEIFKQITIAQTVLDNPLTAVAEIEDVLTACLRFKKPVYIELPRNYVDAPILSADTYERPPLTSDPGAMQEALNEIEAILQTCERPVLWIGHEIQRFGLSKPILEFAEKFHIPIVTSLLGKTAVSEHHPLFAGVYQGRISRDEVRKFVDNCDCSFMLGLVLSDIDTGIFTAKQNHEHRVFSNFTLLNIGHHYYNGTVFTDLVHQLAKLRVHKRFKHDFPKRKIANFIPKTRKAITSTRLFECLQSHLKPEHIVLADIGDSLFGSMDFMLEQDSYLACAYFASLGFCVPGALGAQLACPKRRIIGIVGDGAFQMVSMELSTAVRYQLDPVIIVLNNHGYGTERPLLEGSFNDIQEWNYAEIPRILGGGKGIKVKTEEEFEKALTTALAQRGSFYLIEVDLGKTDFSPAMQRFVDLVSKRDAGQAVAKVQHR